MNETMQLIDTHQIQPGDHVEVVGMGGRWFEVIATDDPALLRLRTDTGKEFSAGRVTVTRHKRQEHEA